MYWTRMNMMMSNNWWQSFILFFFLVYPIDTHCKVCVCVCVKWAHLRPPPTKNLLQQITISFSLCRTQVKVSPTEDDHVMDENLDTHKLIQNTLGNYHWGCAICRPPDRLLHDPICRHWKCCWHEFANRNVRNELVSNILPTDNEPMIDLTLRLTFQTNSVERQLFVSNGHE